MSRITVLSVEHLSKLFAVKSKDVQSRTFVALDDLSFQLYQGEVLGILGPNGAGKTTLIQILLSALTPTRGIINYFGLDFFKHRSTILEKVSFASSYVRLPSQLTVRENLTIYAQMYGISAQERSHRIEKYLKFFDMWNIVDKETGLLSAGQMTRVMLTKAFISHPAIVLLDEPTASLDPDIAQDVRTFIKDQQREQGTSVLITSHNMDEVTEICNRVIVMKKGTIIANDTPKNLALSVSKACVHFMPEHTTTFKDALKSLGISFTDDRAEVSVEIDEHEIAHLLSNLARLEVNYLQISIDKPTLEDYFLSIARGNH